MKVYGVGQKMDAGQALVRSLLLEVFQAERSAQSHPAIEAQRLGDVPPAQPLRRVAEHAEIVLPQLKELADRLGLPATSAGAAVGEMFSQVRDKLADLTLSRERSYRATLIGLRHGYDVLHALEQVARRAGMTELADAARRVLQERAPLIEDVARQLNWFAAHPDTALEPAERSVLSRGAHALVGLFGGLGRRPAQSGTS